MTLFMWQTQGTRGNTTGTVPLWTHALPSPSRQEPCPTTTGTRRPQCSSENKQILACFESWIIVCRNFKSKICDPCFNFAEIMIVNNLDYTIFHLRAQQLLLVKLRKMALEQKEKKKMVRLSLIRKLPEQTITDLITTLNITIRCLLFSIFLHAVLEEGTWSCTTRQGSGPQLSWNWFHTAGPIHAQQT